METKACVKCGAARQEKPAELVNELVGQSLVFY